MGCIEANKLFMSNKSEVLFVKIYDTNDEYYYDKTRRARKCLDEAIIGTNAIIWV